jgi:hypothetical protein
VSRKAVPGSARSSCSFSGASSHSCYGRASRRTFRIPLPFSLIEWLLAVACWLIFARNLRGTPHIEAVSASGDILFYSFNSSRPRRTLNQAEIARFAVESETYANRGPQTENFAVVLIKTADERIVLFASPEETLIRSLASDLASRVGRS